jgi:hypothetical protein
VTQTYEQDTSDPAPDDQPHLCEYQHNKNTPARIQVALVDPEEGDAKSFHYVCGVHVSRWVTDNLDTDNPESYVLFVASPWGPEFRWIEEDLDAAEAAADEED